MKKINLEKIDSIINNVSMYQYKDNDVEVYIASIDNRVDTSIINLTSLSRKQEIETYKFRSDRELMLVGDVLARNFLPQNAIFATDSMGKPFIANYPQIKFNKSHSGNMVGIAISDRNIGIDIEKYDKCDFTLLAERFFSQNEYNEYLTSSDKLDTFFNIWSKKESFLKQTGQGITKVKLNLIEYTDCKFYKCEDIEGYSCWICLSD